MKDIFFMQTTPAAKRISRNVCMKTKSISRETFVITHRKCLMCSGNWRGNIQVPMDGIISTTLRGVPNHCIRQSIINENTAYLIIQIHGNRSSNHVPVPCHFRMNISKSHADILNVHVINSVAQVAIHGPSIKPNRRVPLANTKRNPSTSSLEAFIIEFQEYDALQ